MTIIKRQSGFTMVELLVTMVIFVLVITAASNIFIGLVSNFKQQSKLAETSIEGMVGLKMLKSDVELVGYGLPFDLEDAKYANEAMNEASKGYNATVFNDAPDGVPRAFLTATGGYNGSDIFTVKGSAYGINGTTQKWSYISQGGSMHKWSNLEGTDLKEETLDPGDNVIVVKPIIGSRIRVLAHDANFYTSVDRLQNQQFYKDMEPTQAFLAYGITPTGKTPRMPFNRADFYVRRPATGMPSGCQGAQIPSANSPGILYKAIVGHADGKTVEYPLLDCVAAMKMVMMVDEDGDPATPLTAATAGSWPTAVTSAKQIREQLGEIRIYILAQEGQRDSGYQSPATISITDPDAGTLMTYTVPDRNYRWKIYTMVMKPYNMR